MRLTAATSSAVLFLAAGSLVIAPLVLSASAGAPSSPECFGRPATIVADGFRVSGTPGDDVIVDEKGKGLVESGGGDDLVCSTANAFHEVYGGSGNDRIRGAAGEDIVYPQVGDDLVIAAGGPDLVTDTNEGGNDRLAAGSGVDMIRFSVPYSRTRAPAVTVDLARGEAHGHGRDRISGFEQVEGTAKRDRIRGDRGPNYLRGVRGADTIDGGAGDDTILGATVLYSESGEPIDRLDGSDPALRGGAGADRILGLVGDDRLFGGAGPDLLDGGQPPGAPGDLGAGGPGRDRCPGVERPRSCEGD